jgi:hypothetical protein
MVGVVAAAVMASLTGCTDEDPEPAAPPPPAADPDPPPVAIGATVGVVLPAADRIAEEVSSLARADVARVGSDRGTELNDVRSLVPDASGFVPDLGRTLVERGTSLTCVLGEDAATVTRGLAERHPELRFCAAPVDANVELPDTVRGIEVRAEEAGYLVGSGVAAAVADGGVGVALSGGDLPAARFRAGLLTALGDIEVEIAEVGVDDEGTPQLRDAVAELLAEQVELIVVDGGPDAVAAVELAAATTLVAVPTPLLAGGLATTSTVVSWRVHWDEVLDPAVAELLEEDGSGPWSVGTAEGALSANVGPAATPEVRRALQQARSALDAGEVELDTGDDRPPGASDAPTTGDEPVDPGG